MSLRRIITVLPPVLGLGALAAGLGIGCLSWSMDVPVAADFVSRGLSQGYGVALAAKGRTQVSLLPLPRLGFRDVRLTAGGPDGPVLAEGGSLSIQLDLTALLLGRAEIVSLALDGATIALPESEDDARWAGPVGRLAGHLAADRSAHPRRVTLTHVTLTGHDPRDGHPETARDVDLTLSWPLWSDVLELAGGLTWKGESARFAASGLRPADLAGGGTSPFSASATWAAGSLSAEGSGSLRDGLKLSGQANLQVRSLPETLAWIGGGLALSPLIEDVALDARFEVLREGLQIPAMRVKTGSTVLDGAASVELSGRRPSIRATLDADALNFGPLLAGVLRVTGLDGSDGGWGRHTLALAPLTGGDLDLRLSGSSARLGPLLLDDLAASVMVRANSIDATLNRANLRGGTLKGHLVLADPPGDGADETEMKAQGAFDGIDLAALLVEFGQIGWVVGRTQGAFALEGKGRDADSLVRRVAGRATFAVGNGAIAGLDLADVIQRGGAVAPGALARRNGRTPFDKASIAITFANGVGEVTEGALTGRSLTASLRGRLSLPERQVLARAELLPRAVATGEAATPFEIAGPWDSVAVRGPGRKEGMTGADPLRIPAAPLPGLPTDMRAYAP